MISPVSKGEQRAKAKGLMAFRSCSNSLGQRKAIYSGAEQSALKHKLVLDKIKGLIGAALAAQEKILGGEKSKGDNR